MHELGVLYRAVKMVDDMAGKHKIDKVKHMTLEVGDSSGFVPRYFEKLFPVAVDKFPRMQEAELKIEIVEGRGLSIKEFGY